MQTYPHTQNLPHNHIAASVNVETGEVKLSKKRPNNIPPNKSIIKATYMKRINGSWEFLRKKCTPKEIEVVNHLVDITNYKNNSLEPLSDETSLRSLSTQFNISRRDVEKVFDKLFKLGVYGKFDVYKEIHHKYWVLNPYLSFAGNLVNNELVSLFEGTKIHEAFLEYHNN